MTRVTFPDYDFSVNHYGTLCVLHPVTVAAEGWVKDHLPDDTLWWQNGVVIEPRYLDDILAGIEADDLRISL